MRRMLFVLVLTVCMAAGCHPADSSAPRGRSAHGDCEWTFEEKVGKAQVPHRYPELAEGIGEWFVFGKVIITCGHPPARQRTVLRLQVRPPGSHDWRTPQFNESNEVPRPKMGLVVQATCPRGLTRYWRLHLVITGEGIDSDGHPTAFEVEDLTEERRIECPS
jgi:hypothetical protein